MLWQKSPQYANMPHEQYMQTEEGKRSQQAFQQWGQWQQNNMPTPSKPGPGRPSTPMQPQGMTPSKPGPGRPSVPMQNYAPGQAKPQQSPYATATPYGAPQPASQSQQPVRPPPFQSTTRNFDGTTSQMPNFQQRDAFIAQINNQLGQMQNQSWQRPGMGAPQFNFPQMWGQAGQMAEQGFRNPFAVPAGQQVASAPLSQPGGPAGAGRLHSGFPQMAGDIVPGAVGQPMSPQMLDLLRQRPGVVF